MSSEWELKKLEDVIELVIDNRGRNPKEHVKNGIPVIDNYLIKSNGRVNVKEVNRYIDEDTYKNFLRKYIEPGDVLMTLVGNGYGQVAIAPDEQCAIIQNTVGFRCNKDNCNLYLYYLLRNNREVFLNLNRGAAQPSIKVGDVLNRKFYFPNKKNQEDISEFLFAFDNRITLLRETNATLEAMAQSLFKSWFVDFDPVHAKQQGRAPEGMEAATAALFPDSFEESELGMVPKGWKVGALGDIAQTVKKQLQPEKMHSGMHYVGLEHIPRKSLSLAAWGAAEGLESAKAIFNTGDVLFGKLRPYFHKVVIAPVDGVCSTDVLVCRPKKPADYGVVAMHLFSSDLIDYADRISNGAKMPRVNWSDLAAYPVVVAPEQIATCFTEFAMVLFSRMEEGIHRAQILASLRDTLLPRLISGQLRLPEAEALAEQAMVS